MYPYDKRRRICPCLCDAIMFVNPTCAMTHLVRIVRCLRHISVANIMVCGPMQVGQPVSLLACPRYFSLVGANQVYLILSCCSATSIGASRKLRHAVNQVLQDKVSKDQTNVKEELAKVQRERLGEAERMRNAHVAARLPLKMAVEVNPPSDHIKCRDFDTPSTCCTEMISNDEH